MRGEPFRPPRLLRCLSWAEHGAAGEDRWAARGRAWALCDGASEGFDGAGWAGCLARQLVSAATVDRSVGRALDRSVGRARAIYAQVPRRRASGEDWLAELGALRGSWSTALLVRVSPSRAFVEVCARGDTVFFLRDGLRTVASFPLDDPAAFGSTSDLVADRAFLGPIAAAEPFRRVVYNLRCLRRPLLALATDALAQRVFRSEGAERRELWTFLDTCSSDGFRRWARSGMDEGTLGRDDLTLLELAP